MRRLIACALLVASSSLFAKDGAGPCKDDRKTICAGIEKGQGRMAQCLFKNWDRVSDPCKAKRQARYDKWKSMEAACGGDIAKLCQGESTEKGGKRKCLRNNKKELSEPCTTFLKANRGQRKGKKGKRNQEAGES